MTDIADGAPAPTVWSIDLSAEHFAWWPGWHISNIAAVDAMLEAVQHLVQGRKRTFCGDCAHTELAPFVLVLDQADLSEVLCDEERRGLAATLADVRAMGAAYNVHVMEWQAWDSRRSELWPADAARRSDAVYHGRMVEHRGGVIVIETPQGRALDTVPHVDRHSPTGIGWGYEGSGAADCALSILVDALGDAAVCRACEGAQKIVYGVAEESDRFDPYDELEDLAGTYEGREIQACPCDRGLIALPYQDFKREFVAKWPQAGEWRLSRHEVLAWFATNRGAAMNRH